MQIKANQLFNERELLENLSCLEWMQPGARNKKKQFFLPHNHGLLRLQFMLQPRWQIVKGLKFACCFNKMAMYINMVTKNIEALMFTASILFVTIILMHSCWLWGGTVASWLARSTLEWAVRVWALAGDFVLWSWERHFILTVPLSTHVYKIGTAKFNAGGNPVMD